ncbi:hypothetical protein [Synechococcus sp. MIT S9508]|uniref:hypothetical protein n=1 Tax=Synechococcus sp. MIT S9508 TaxID=1801629 RepID=UPI0018D35F40
MTLLTQGRIEVDVRHDNQVHTLAEVEALELLSEVSFFVNGKHCGDFRVINKPAQLQAIP